MHRSLVFVVILAANASALSRERNGTLYIASSSYLQYNEAKTFCSDNGAILVKVRSLEEAKWIADNVVGGHDYWIGAEKTGTRYKWADGEALVWTQWYRDHPQFCTDSCCKVLILGSTHEWFAQYCGHFPSYHAVCQTNSTVLIDKYRNETVDMIISTNETVNSSSSLENVDMIASRLEAADKVASALDKFRAKSESKDNDLSGELRDLSEGLRAVNLSITLQQEQLSNNDSDLGAKMGDLARTVRDMSSAFLGLRGSREIQIQIWALAGVLLVSVVVGTAVLLILRRKILVISEDGFSYQLKKFPRSRNPTFSSAAYPRMY